VGARQLHAAAAPSRHDPERAVACELMRCAGCTSPDAGGAALSCPWALLWSAAEAPAPRAAARPQDFVTALAEAEACMASGALPEGFFAEDDDEEPPAPGPKPPAKPRPRPAAKARAGGGGGGGAATPPPAAASACCGAWGCCRRPARRSARRSAWPARARWRRGRFPGARGAWRRSCACMRPQQEWLRRASRVERRACCPAWGCRLARLQARRAAACPAGRHKHAGPGCVGSRAGWHCARLMLHCLGWPVTWAGPVVWQVRPDTGRLQEICCSSVRGCCTAPGGLLGHAGSPPACKTCCCY